MESKSRPIALVTGAAGGIGRAIVSVFTEAGWRVIAVDRKPELESAEWVRYFQVDLEDPKAVSDLFANLEGELSRLDALVNNAAIQIAKPLLETAVDEWDAIMNVNLRSIFLTAKHGFPLLAAASGAIVNVSSIHAVATSNALAAYAASKGGVVALTRAMALEFAAQGIRANALLPGAVDTGMLREGLSRGHLAAVNPQDQLQELGARIALRRIGHPEEIAQAVLFLADREQSSFMTGQTLVVDGGALARLSTE